MTLNSFRFVVFLSIVLIVELLFSRMKNESFRGHLIKISLTIFSLIFMLAADWRYALCLVGYALFIFLISQKINSLNAKPWMIVGVVGSLGLLGYFKYVGFFVDGFAALMGHDPVALKIWLPLGISFYTFTGISYLMDVYRRNISASRSLEDVMLYMVFFPKVSSGPIVRAKDFLQQLERPTGVTLQGLEIGIWQFVIGMFKKMVLADHLAVFVNQVFAYPTSFHSATILWAAISYSLQIYFDFSGYSDMAIGISRMLGFRFEKNFNFPYLSRNLTEFWKRWHISLSSWLQDYLYIPLGGNRKGTCRTYINLMITMILGGLWHGADWSFVMWGALHGIGLVVHKLFVEWKRKHNIAVDNCWLDGISVLLTFVYASFCWIFFRASDIQNACEVIKGMLRWQDGVCQPYTWTFLALLLCVLSEWYAAKREICAVSNKFVDQPVLRLNTFWGLTAFFVLCGLTIGMAYVGETYFIYGAF